MEFMIGHDVSSLLCVEDCGGRFFDRGVEDDALKILNRYGANYVRLRLWNDPFDETGKPYGAGNCDIETVLKLARRAKDLGMKWLFDVTVEGELGVLAGVEDEVSSDHHTYTDPEEVIDFATRTGCDSLAITTK